MTRKATALFALQNMINDLPKFPQIFDPTQDKIITANFVGMYKSVLRNIELYIVECGS